MKPSLKIKDDSELTEKESMIFGIANEISRKTLHDMSELVDQGLMLIIENIKQRSGETFEFKECMSYLGKILNNVYCTGLIRMVYIGKKFEDTDYNIQTCFNEMTEGARILLKLHSESEYPGGIKKI